MTDQGPICHLPSPTVGASHDPVSLPSIPPAQPNIQSLTATVNAMRQVLMIYTGQRGARGTPGATGAQGKTGKPAPSGSWSEVSRVTETVKVYQNNDPTSQNWVEVERLNKLVMKNKDTQQTWTWDRERK